MFYVLQCPGTFYKKRSVALYTTSSNGGRRKPNDADVEPAHAIRASHHTLLHHCLEISYVPIHKTSITLRCLNKLKVKACTLTSGKITTILGINLIVFWNIGDFLSSNLTLGINCVRWVPDCISRCCVLPARLCHAVAHPRLRPQEALSEVTGSASLWDAGGIDVNSDGGGRGDSVASYRRQRNGGKHNH